MRSFWLYIFFIVPAVACAQNEFRRFSVGVNAGLTTINSDLPSSKYNPAFGGTADVYITKYINAGVEVQKGKLSGSETRATGRFFENDYKAFTVFGKIHLGQFIGSSGRYHFNDEGIVDRVIKGLYIGSGGGFISSTQVKIKREKEPAYRGVNANKELFIPVLAGFDIYTSREPRIMVCFKYEANFSMGDNIDGYYVPGSKNDVFSVFSVGLKYVFGPLSLN